MVYPAAIAITLGIGIGAVLFLLYANSTSPSQNRYRQNEEEPRNSWRDPYNEMRNQYLNDVCSICLENIDDKDEGKLQCRHRFHRKCIDESLRHSPYCPMCRCEAKYMQR